MTSRELILRFPFTIKEVNEKYGLKISSQLSKKKISLDISKDEDLINLNKKYQKEITELKEKLSLYEHVDKLYSSFNDQNIEPVNIDFINVDNNFNNKTNLACLVCTEPFDCFPHVLPEKYKGGTYYVYGCFCSVGCVARFNLMLNDDRVSHRLSLIKKFYSQLFGRNMNNIIPSPPKETLKKFGGPLSITEYRKKTQILKKTYRVIYPPMTYISSSIEEINHRESSDNICNDELVLKRTKPLPNKRQNLESLFSK